MSLPDSRLCTGCGACKYACKKGAIELLRDSCGFLHPEIDSSICTDCGLCERVCPVISKAESQAVKSVYVARATQNGLEQKSSSGGAFSVFAEYIISKGGVVYGAGFDEDFNVCHKRVESKEQLSLIRGSKYVQSNFYEAAVNAVDDLKGGKEVLFSGTPCQVAAIKNMASEYKDRLYLVDFICHGVPSPGLFEKYKDFIRGGRKITALSFRDKTEGWRTFSMKIGFADGTSYRKLLTQDPYLLAFLQNVSLRSSCYNCCFLGTERLSDVTLGDAWTQSFKSEELSDGKGVSLLLINSCKGQQMLGSVKDEFILEELELSETEKIKPLNFPTAYNPLRDMYFKDMNRLSFDKLTHKYCGSSLTAKLRRFLVKKAYGWRN